MILRKVRCFLLDRPSFIWKGYVRIRLIGSQPERFLNLCAYHRIGIWDLRLRDGYYEMNMSVGDVSRLLPLCRKSGSRIKILEKHGMPFLLHRSAKRKAFLLGIFLCCFLFLFLSSFIWNIHVEGNYANSTESILNSLEEIDIVHGIRKSKVNCQNIAAYLREQFPNVTWVSAKIEGTRLILEMKENIDNYESESAQEEPVSLVAAKDGKVLSIVTRAGTPKVLAGEECVKGDVLVDGEIPLTNDNMEVYDYRYVHADADIYLETQWYYYDQFSLRYQVRTDSETGRKDPYIQIGNYRIRFHIPEDTAGQEFFDELCFEKQLYLTENFALPFYYGYIQKLPYTMEEEIYTEQEACDLSDAHFQKFSENLSEKGLQISENHVKIEFTDTECITKGTLRVIERAVEEKPCEIQNVSSGKDDTVE
ncbi:MAG: sporulation protein YqfD [Lachnospiraceae bacterium]|nr:sporulation protein YqfD [Lachnospiraceae bacterium]